MNMVIIEHLPSRISSRQIPTTSNLRNKKSSNRKKNCKPSIITKLTAEKKPSSWDLMVKTRSFELANFEESRYISAREIK